MTFKKYICKNQQPGYFTSQNCFSNTFVGPNSENISLFCLLVFPLFINKQLPLGNQVPKHNVNFKELAKTYKILLPLSSQVGKGQIVYTCCILERGMMAIIC